MKKKLQILAIVLAALLLLMFVSGILGGLLGYNRGKAVCESYVPDTVRIETTDTCYLPSPPDTVTNVITKVVTVPLSDVEVDNDVDSARVSLPFEQHQAHLEDVADVWVSGYMVKIDSAVVYKHHTTEIIRQPYEVARTPRLTTEIGAAAFYCDGMVNPCLVGEIRYNAQKTTFSAFGAIDHEGRWAAGVGVTYRLNIIK